MIRLLTHSKGTLRCCKDIDPILLYLLFEKRSEVLVVLHQVYRALQKLLKVLGCQHMVEELRRHGDEQIHVTALMVLVAGHGAKQAHGGDAKLLSQLRGVFPDDVNILLRTSHNAVSYLLAKVLTFCDIAKQYGDFLSDRPAAVMLTGTSQDNQRDF